MDRSAGHGIAQEGVAVPGRRGFWLILVALIVEG